jgi:hypothetical protein
VFLFNLLYTPSAWSETVNSDVYEVVAFLLQVAEAHNITIGGGTKYNVPSEPIVLHPPPAASPSLTSYTQVAISGADNFNDDRVTVKDVFDVVVNNTRNETPTCEFPIVRLYLFVLLTRIELSRNHLVSWVRASGCIARKRILTTTSSVTLRMDGLSVLLNSSRHSALNSSRTEFSS